MTIKLQEIIAQFKKTKPTGEQQILFMKAANESFYEGMSKTFPNKEIDEIMEETDCELTDNSEI